VVVGSDSCLEAITGTVSVGGYAGGAGFPKACVSGGGSFAGGSAGGGYGGGAGFCDGPDVVMGGAVLRSGPCHEASEAGAVSGVRRVAGSPEDIEASEDLFGSGGS